MSDRKINYIVIFAVIALFVLEANVAERLNLLAAILISMVAAYAVFIANLITIDGTRAAILVGTVTLGFGGTEPFVMLAAFFLSSNVIGPILGRSQFTQRFMSERRTGAQVWANGFWFIIAVLSWFVTKGDMFLIAAFAALATANADTWATEAGTRINFGKTRSILGFKAVPRGTDGGVSVPGTLAAVAGAVFIGAITLYFPKNFMFLSAVSIAAAGFLGSLTDSVLGAWFQAGNRTLPLFFGTGKDKENNTVNFVATGLGMLYGLILYNLLIYALV
ncbi:MAG: putative membrane protein [Bacteroidetes bacterium HLUCCA01]|nr:MAG: putative membrane protein [Bacteroidetes bacterium HLUCCA01]